MYVDQALVDQVVALVGRDLSATLGWDSGRAEAVVRAEAENQAHVEVWGDDPEVDSAFILKVAEETQQVLHDTFEDTTWPTCPVHMQHPLWLEPGTGELPTWRCPADHTSYGRLGELETPPVP
jgi:hypothetical protein